MRQKFKDLQIDDETAVLLMDEIRIKPYFDYKVGNIVGRAFNFIVMMQLIPPVCL